jgi:hypothetical protein
MMNSLQGTRRSNLNEDQFRINDKRQILLDFITYGINLIHNREMSIEEFLCPDRYDETFLSRRTTEACECMNKGAGCSKIKICKSYDDQKQLEKLFPNIRWDFPINAQEEQIIKINFIKKGVISNIFPKEQEKVKK